MADLTTSAVVEIPKAANGVTKAVDKDKAWTVFNTGAENDGVTTGADQEVFVGTAAEPTADFTAEDDKIILWADDSCVVGPGVPTLYLRKKNAGADEVMVNLVPSKKHFGVY